MTTVVVEEQTTTVVVEEFPGAVTVEAPGTTVVVEEFPGVAVVVQEQSTAVLVEQPPSVAVVTQVERQVIEAGVAGPQGPPGPQGDQGEPGEGSGPHELAMGPHTESGLTARHVLRATSATTFAFGAIEVLDLPDLSAVYSIVSHDHDADYDPIGSAAAVAADLVTHAGLATHHARQHALNSALDHTGAFDAAQHPTINSGNLHPEYLTQTEADGLYDPVGAANAAVATHAGLADPHPGYLTQAEGDALYGAGAPNTADYLVGTAQAGLSGEIVVGTSPGGELGGTWASPTVDASHSGSTHAATQAAAEATSAAALATHEADTTSVHGIVDTSQIALLNATNVFTEHNAFGNTATIDQDLDGSASKSVVNVNEVFADTDADIKFGLRSDVEIDPPGATNNYLWAADLVARVATGNTQAVAYLAGADFVARHQGSGLLSTARAGSGNVQNLGGGTITNAMAFEGIINNPSGGTITTAAVVKSSPAFGGAVGTYYGGWFKTPTGSGVITNAYGVYIEDHSAKGTTNSYNLYSAGASAKNFFQGTVQVDGALIVPRGTTPAQTAEGSVFWDSDDDALTVGTGAGRKTLSDTSHTHTLAPADADYLVGTAHAGLSGEIVVGTSPGGELGGTWASPTVDASHSGSTHAATQAAAESTAAAALTAHEAAADPHSTYLTQTEADALYPSLAAYSAHTANVDGHHARDHALSGSTHTGTISDVQHPSIASGNLHPEYLTQAEGDALYDPVGAGVTTPTFIANGDTVVIAENTQMLHALTIDIEGFLDADGWLVQV